MKETLGEEERFCIRRVGDGGRIVDIEFGGKGGHDSEVPTPTPTPEPETLTIGMINEAGVGIHVYVYVDGVQVASRDLGTGMLSKMAVIELTYGGDITTRFDLSFTTWHVCAAYPGNHVDIYYYLDGDTSYIKT